MNNARDNILARIRNANQQLVKGGSEKAVNERIQQHSRGPQPQWSGDLLVRFTEKTEQAASSYETVKDESEIVSAVSAYLTAQSLENKIVCAGTALLERLEWPYAISAETRLATTDDKVVLVEAFAAIAETGSIVMYSDKQTPTSLNFLPDHFLCVVNKRSIVSHMEDIWERLRAERESFPRAINIVTGPSRTADVEQIIQMGAHGPRRVHLLLLD